MWPETKTGTINKKNQNKNVSDINCLIQKNA